MSTGPIHRKSKSGPRKIVRHEIFSATVAWDTTPLYKGDKNIATAADSTEASGGEWPIKGLDPNKKYVITHMRAVLSAAPGEVVTVVLRQNGSDSSLGVCTFTATDTEAEAAFQDLVTHGAYVTIKITAAATCITSTLKAYLTIEEV